MKESIVDRFIKIKNWNRIQDLVREIYEILNESGEGEEFSVISVPISHPKVEGRLHLGSRFEINDDEAVTLDAFNGTQSPAYLGSDNSKLFLGQLAGQSYVAKLTKSESQILQNHHFEFIELAFKYLSLKVSSQSLNNLIYIDEVSNLFNQRKLGQDLEKLIDDYHECKENFTILFLDIDNFKKVNDGHGHVIGTKLLMSAGQIVKNNIRESDLAYRYGGDEFVVILPSTQSTDGMMVAERILTALKTSEINLIDEEVEKKFVLSVSIGVAEYPKDASSKEEILSMADRMMYEAKKRGKGIVFQSSTNND